MVRFFLICIGTIALLSSLSAQPRPFQYWTYTAGGDTSDWADDILQTADGGYVAVGTTYSNDVGGGDMYVVKIDSMGMNRWSHTFGSIYHDDGRVIYPTPDGGFILGGSTKLFQNAPWCINLVKINSMGNSLWQHTLLNVALERPYGIAPAADGGYVVLGGSPFFESNPRLHKINASGMRQWVREYFSAVTCLGKTVKQTPDSGYIIAGETASQHAFLTKTNESGNIEWTRTYSSHQTEGFNAVILTEGGGYLLTGYAQPIGSNRGMWILKTDAEGDVVWDRHEGNDVDWNGCKLAYTQRGDFMVAGTVDTNFILVRFDSLGNQRWNQTYFAYMPSSYYNVGFVVTRDQAYVLAGTVRTFSGREDLYVVKTGRDRLATAADPSSITIPKVFSLSVYPNPFNPTTTISFDLPQAQEVDIRVFDINGKTVGTPLGETKSGILPAGEHVVQFDGSGLPSGIYFVRVESGVLNQTQKMVLLK